MWFGEYGRRRKIVVPLLCLPACGLFPSMWSEGTPWKSTPLYHQVTNALQPYMVELSNTKHVVLLTPCTVASFVCCCRFLPLPLATCLPLLTCVMYSHSTAKATQKILPISLDKARGESMHYLPGIAMSRSLLQKGPKATCLNGQVQPDPK